MNQNPTMQLNRSSDRIGVMQFRRFPQMQELRKGLREISAVWNSPFRFLRHVRLFAANSSGRGSFGQSAFLA
jgi:hypothetical protein